MASLGGLVTVERHTTSADSIPRLRRLAAIVAALLVVAVGGLLPGTPLRRLVIESAPSPPVSPSERDASLVVRVVTEQSGPIALAQVRALAIVDGRAYLSSAAQTGRDGAARLDRLPRGEHWLLVDARGYARGTSHLLLVAGNREVTHVLKPEHRLVAQVNDERGAPIADAQLEVTQGDEPLPVGARTGVDGVAQLGRLGAAPWRVSARAPGYEEVLLRGVREGEKATFVLRRLGALVVRVVSGDAPAAGAQVFVAGATLWPARAATAGADGTVRIGGLGAGSYALRATLHGLASPIDLGVALARGEEKPVLLRLEQGRVIAVHVLDGDDDQARPIARARVMLAESGLSPFPVEGGTDKDGYARLGPIAAGPASVAVRADGFVARGAIDVPEALSTALRVALVKAGVLRGRVVDDRGQPVDGASIEVVGTDFWGAPIDDDPRRSRFREAHFAAMLPGPTPLVPAGELGVLPGPIPPIPRAVAVPDSRSTGGAGAIGPVDEPWVTRNDGTFVAKPVSPGRVRALVRHPQYVEAQSEIVTLQAGGEAEVTVTLHGGGSLDGRVVDASGRGVAGVRVLVSAERGSFERSATTATDGTFVFVAVPDRVLVAVVRGDDTGDVAVRVPVLIPDGGRKTVTLTLPPDRPALGVRVTDDRGYPVDAAELSASSLDPGAPLRSTAFTDARGDASIAGAQGLPLRVEVRAPRHVPRVVVVAAEQRELRVALDAAFAVRGEVREARSGSAVDGAEIVLYTNVGVDRARADRTGGFTFAEVATGSARLVVRAKGYADASVDVTIAVPANRRPFELPRVELRPEIVASGVVVDARGEPVAGARVARDRVPTFIAAGPAPPGVAVTDARGRFRLVGLAEGATAIEAYAPDTGYGRVEGLVLRAGRSRTDLRVVLARDGATTSRELPSAGGVAVTLGELSGEPREVVIVAVAEASAAERAGLAPDDVLVDVDGLAVHSMAEARARLSGPLGHDVLVRFRRGDRTELRRVPREEVRR